MRIKQSVAVITAVLFLFSGLLMSQGKSAVDEAFLSFDKMMSIIKVSSVIGKPIQEGKTIIIPFSKISYGLGAGGAMMGYGGGMGGKTIPLGVLVIEGDEVRAELFPFEEKKPSFFMQMLPMLIEYLPKLMGQKAKPKATPLPPKKEKDKSEAPAGEGSLDQAIKLFDQKKYSEALDIVDSLLAADPNNPDLHAWRGNVMGSLASSGNTIDMMKYGMEAMGEYERALELDPEHGMAHFGRGMGRLVAPPGFGGDLDGAIEDLEFACKKESFPDAYYQLGVAYEMKGEIGKAKEAFKKALELNPEHKDAAKALAELK